MKRWLSCLIGLVFLGMTWFSAAPARAAEYEYIRFVQAPAETSVVYEDTPAGDHQLMLRHSSGKCLLVKWAQDLPSPSVTRFSWGYSVRAAFDHALVHYDTAAQMPDSPDTCIENKTLGIVSCDYCHGGWHEGGADPDVGSGGICCTWACNQPASATQWCDTSDETPWGGGGGNTSVDAGATCD